MHWLYVASSEPQPYREQGVEVHRCACGERVWVCLSPDMVLLVYHGEGEAKRTFTIIDNPDLTGMVDDWLEQIHAYESSDSHQR